MSKTAYIENTILNSVLRGIPFTPPVQTYVGLFTSVPLPNGAGTEVVGGAYARQAVLFSTPEGGSVSNLSEIVFPVATLSWGTVVAFTLFDAPFAGNMLYYVEVSPGIPIQAGDQLKYTIGSLTVSET